MKISKLGPISPFLSPVSCDSLVLQGLRWEWGEGVFNLVLSLSYWSLEVQHGTSWQRTLWGSEKKITGELQFIEGTMNANMYCDILKQSMIPSLRRLGRRAVLQHNNDQCLVKEAEAKGDGLAKHVSRPKPYWASVGHPQKEGGGAQGF